MSDTQKICFIKIGDHSLPQPNRSTKGSVGYDLRSTEDVKLPPGGRRLIKTGYRLSMPHGIECQIRPRSGLALKNGVTVLNSPGTIDSDYDLEVGVILVNHGNEEFSILVGDRVAQAVFSKVELLEDDVDNERAGGFGSTGRT